MKKLIFSLAIVSIILFACNPLKPKSGAEKLIFVEKDSISGTTATAMIAHYKDANVNKQNSGFEAVGLNDTDLFEIFKIKNITRVRFFLAAYLADDPQPSRQNKVAVIMQLKQGYHSNYYYYDATAYLCPPPMGCSN